MKGNVPVVEATRDEGVLPERVQEALGELAVAGAGAAPSVLTTAKATRWRLLGHRR